MSGTIERKVSCNIREKLESTIKEKPVFLNVTGELGTGKTFFAKEILDYLKGKGFTVAYAETTSESQFDVFEKAVKGSILEDLIIEKPAKINNVFLTDNAGTMMADASSEGFEADHDILASMIEAVQSFVKDSFSTATPGFVELITERSFNMYQYGAYKIATLRAPYGALTCLLEGDVPETLNMYMDSILNQIENSEYKELLDSWDGTLSKVKGMDKILEPLLDIYEEESFSVYEKEFRVKEGFLKKIPKFENKKIAFVFDDIDRADVSSISLLESLPKNLKKDFVVLLTSKTDLGLKEYETFKFDNFNIEETKEFADMLLDSTSIPEEFVSYVFEKTNGNPLLLKKNVEYLKERGFKFENWKSDLKEKGLTIFSSLQEVTKFELGKQDEEVYNTLEYLSVFGQAIDESSLGEINHKHLTHLLESNILKKIEGGYGFVTHELREQVYDNISDETLFLKVAESYENGMKDVTSIKKLASLYYEVAIRNNKQEHIKKSFENVFEWISKISERTEKFDEKPLHMGKTLVDMIKDPDIVSIKTKLFDKELLAFAVNNKITNLYELTDELLESSLEEGNYDLFALSVYYKTRRKYKKRQLREADEFLRESLKKLEGQKIKSEYMGKLQFQKAVNLRELYSQEKELSFAEESIKTLEKLLESDLVKGNEEVRIRSKLELINVYVTDFEVVGKFDKEETKQKIRDYISEMEELLEKEPPARETVKGIYFNLSNKEVVLGNYEKAITLNKKILDMTKEYEITSISDAVNNILWANLMKGNYKEVIDIHEQYYPLAVRHDVPIKHYFKQNYAMALLLTGMENLIESLKAVPLASVEGDFKNKPEFFMGLDYFLPGVFDGFCKEYNLDKDSYSCVIKEFYKKYDIEPREQSQEIQDLE